MLRGRDTLTTAKWFYMAMMALNFNARPLGTADEFQLAALIDYNSSPSYFPIN
jgi:hypothetical protein